MEIEVTEDIFGGKSGFSVGFYGTTAELKSQIFKTLLDSQIVRLMDRDFEHIRLFVEIKNLGKLAEIFGVEVVKNLIKVRELEKDKQELVDKLTALNGELFALGERSQDTIIAMSCIEKIRKFEKNE